MSNMICRLCLNDVKLINIFDVRLTNSEQLRKCILLATGVEIGHDDIVSKYICEYCSDIAIFLYKYRKKAIANDKALKEYANQKFVEPLTQTKDILKFNNQIVELLKDGEEKEEERPPEIVNNLFIKQPESRTKPSSSTGLAVHPTIIHLIKNYPKLKIPNDLLKSNIQPRILLNKNEIDNWRQQLCRQEKEMAEKEISDIERFKLMCPGISIMKIIQPVGNTIIQPIGNKQSQSVKLAEKLELVEIKPVEDKLPENKVACTVVRSEASIESLTNNVLKKRKASSASPSDLSKKKKLKEQDVSTADIKERLSRKRNPPKRLATPIDEPNVPKLKIVLRRPSENSTPTPDLEEVSKRPSLEESTRKPIYHGRTWIKPQILQSATVEIHQEGNQSQESDNQKILPVKLHRNNVFASDTEHSDNESVGANDYISSEDLLDTVEEVAIVHCGVCNKMFNTLHQLKCHERVHKVCAICKMIFRSNDALRYHEKDICFKTVMNNPPNLRLTKVDDDPEILRLYPGAFFETKQYTGDKVSIIASTSKGEKASLYAEEVLCISDDDDDDVVIVDSSNQDLDDSITNSNEFQYIRNVFSKYKDVKLPFTKQKATETKPKIFVKYNQKNQIVLENMYPELKSFRVPVELIAKPTSFAYIAFSKKPPEPRDIYCWANEPVVKLAEKKHLLSILLNPSPTRTKYQPILPKTSHPQYKKTEVPQTHSTIHNLKSLPTQTTSNVTTIKSHLTQTTTNKSLPTQTTSNVTVAKVMPPLTLLNKNAPSNTIQDIPSTSSSTTTVSTNQNAVDTPPIETTAKNDTTKAAEVPVTTTAPKENSFCLRVKTPWELNTL